MTEVNDLRNIWFNVMEQSYFTAASSSGLCVGRPIIGCVASL